MANLNALIKQQPQGLNKGPTNFITLGPELADISITDTYNTLLSGTNYFNIVAKSNQTTFVNDTELRTAIAYRDIFKQGDAVTAFNQFYNIVQTATFANSGCTLDTIFYWANKLINSNKELAALNSQGSIFGNKILPNLNPAVSQAISQGFLNGHHSQQSFFQNNDKTSIGNLLVQLQALSGSTVNTLADSGVPNQSYFTNVSDSIGTLANTKYIQTDSTLPIFDVNQQFYGVPIPYSASTDRKISNNTRNIAYNLSIATTALMRRNLLNIAYTQPAIQQNMASDATVAHGLNLINDLPTFAQLNTSLGNLVKALSSRFKVAKVFQFIQYLNNIGNKTGFNLRDIFPVTGQDRDFTVITSAQRSLASAAETKSISDAAVIDAYGEQQGINYANQYSGAANGGYVPGGASSSSFNGAVGSTQTANADGSVTISGALRRNNDGNANPPAGDVYYQGQTSSGIANNDPNIPTVTAPLGSSARSGDVVWVSSSNSQGSTGFYAVVNDKGPAANGWGEMGQSALSLIPGAQVPSGRDAVEVPHDTVTTIIPIGQRVPTHNLAASTTAFNNIKGGA